MDRPTTRTEADAPDSRFGPPDAFVLPSRRPALELCRARLRASPGSTIGPILVTGEAGVGKTWLWRLLQAETPRPGRWIDVDFTPTDDPNEFYRLIAHELGLIEANSGRASRVSLVDFLTERQADGERLSLVIEEAHNLSMPVWEEVRVLSNRLDRPGGFATMILVGQTSLARRITTRSFAAIEGRLTAKVHLGPIDADEAKALLDHLRPGQDWAMKEVEILHRDSSGNPRRLLRKIMPIGAAVARAIPLVSDPVLPISRPAFSPAPLTGPARPPIEADENMIEVGWSPDDVPNPEESGEGAPNLAIASPTSEEAVLDHYAALQAWREWSENQARPVLPVTVIAETEPSSLTELDDDVEAEEENLEDEVEPLPSSRTDRPRVWVDGEQKFAPFGQLFTRMAQSREPE